ncbi:secreted RxLR effector protein 161-like [Vicia villosa]|uniref:secreted RxLR effector protein 161-like n=1 Tax=Vicia villosa TaxID=3911 RepID=UPI00273CD633|nr:secreted RxLR effector protein 161-like [Vicia villosa]
MYGMICNRLDLAYAINVISRFMADPRPMHWCAPKLTMRYLNGSLKLGLRFKRVEQDIEPIKGYVDSDYACNTDTRKSISGYVFTLFGTSICWMGILQSVVALSTTQAEFIALTESVKEACV